MRGKGKQIKQSLADILAANADVVSGKVVSVEDDSCEVEPSDDSLPNLPIVRLRSILDGSTSGFYGVPSVGAEVLVLMISKNEAFLLSSNSYSGIVLRTDGHGGLVKVEGLLERLNAIENKLNELLNAVKSHTHSPVPPNGTAPPSLGLADLTPVDNTTREEIENEAVKHG